VKAAKQIDGTGRRTRGRVRLGCAALAPAIFAVLLSPCLAQEGRNWIQRVSRLETKQLRWMPAGTPHRRGADR
jgi:hypothetical protein